MASGWAYVPAMCHFEKWLIYSSLSLGGYNVIPYNIWN
jgi:hypothetical protein